MKTIGSFKLNKRGEEGIEVKSQQLSIPISGEKDKVYRDHVNTFREEIVPPHILKAIERLKYYFLHITGYWIDPYNAYLDLETNLLKPVQPDSKPGRIHLQELWESVHVTQVRIDDGSFQLMGQIEVIDSKPLNLNPAKVVADDAVPFYENAREIIRSIIMLLAQYFSTAALSDVDGYRKYLMAHSDETRKEEIAGFDEGQVVNAVMDELSRQGAIIMMDAGAAEEIAQHEDVNPVADIDLDPEPEPEPEPVSESEHEPEPANDASPGFDSGDALGASDWNPEPEKAPEPFGQPAAEDGRADENVTELPSEEFEGIDNQPDDDIMAEGDI